MKDIKMKAIKANRPKAAIALPREEHIFTKARA